VRGRLLLAGAIATALSCGGSGPSVQPSPTIEDPVVSCPSDISVTAHSGSSPTAVFDVPTASKGAPPVTVSCTPSSGSQFSDGVTNITCEAIDSRAHKGSCSFSVVVTPVPHLLKTKFMALGDSLTEGKTRVISGIIVVPGNTTPPIFNAAGSYPEILNSKLAARYQDQTITMVAFGRGLETAGEGKIRLRDYWDQFNADAVMLLEGTNDLTDVSTNTTDGINRAMDSVVEALRTDIVFAKGKGARVFLGTLLPLLPPVAPNPVAAVPVVNVRIKALAVEQNVTLVDINAAVPPSMISTIDGIHPKPGSDAYSLMADAWLNAIIATMEVKPSTTP
jgi:lysophospholipase L1-like esterase